MSALARYSAQDKARFDFRIYDGMGEYITPDWDDPDLKVEFYDANNELKFTASASSNPALGTAEDELGAFIYVEGIDLSDFASGVCTAHIYCKVSGAKVFPYPTVIEAFEVVAGVGTEPVYTTISKVKQELPAELPSELTDEIISQYIYDASRRIDAFLNGYYAVPFADINKNPSTPALIERLCRKLAINDCLIFLGTINQIDVKPALEEWVIKELERLRKGEIRLSGYQAYLSVYQGELCSDESSSPCLLYTSPSPRDLSTSRMPSSA